MNTALLEAINRTCEASVAYGVGPVELVPSGIPQLDATIGGIPRGRIIEIHGGEGSGKTALALHLAQQLGGPVLYIDADHGLSPYILGDQELYLLDVPSLENAMDACWTAAVGGFSAVVVDTVAALPTNEDLRVSINDKYPLRERHAQIMAKALPKIVGLLNRTGCTLILVNQMRNKHGVFYGRPDYPTGGKAVGYFAALRLETRRVEQIGHSTGQVVAVNVCKCKYGPPGICAAVDLVYGEGLTHVGPLSPSF